MRAIPLLLASVLAITACGPATPAQAPTAAASPTPSPAPTHTFKSGDRVTIVVPFPAGGGIDLSARILQPHLERAFKQVTGVDATVGVENVAGASGQLGVEQSYRAAADGKQLVLAGIADLASQQTIRGAAFDARKMTPIAQISGQPRVILIRPGVIPADGDFNALLARSRQKPILYGQGAPEVTKLTFAIFKENGVDFRADQVLFDGTAPAVASLLRNEIEVYSGVVLSSALTQVKANPTLRVLVSFGPDRDPQAPDLKTLKDLGVKGADRIADTVGTVSNVFLGPPNISAPNAAVIQEAFRVAMTNKAYTDESASKGQPVAYKDAKEVSRLITAAIDLYEKNKDLIK